MAGHVRLAERQIEEQRTAQHLVQQTLLVGRRIEEQDRSLELGLVQSQNIDAIAQGLRSEISDLSQKLDFSNKAGLRLQMKLEASRRAVHIANEESQR